MLDLANQHAGFVLAAYGLSGLVLAVLVIATLLRSHNSKADESDE